MAVSSKAGAAAVFDLKSAALSVLALRLKTTDLATLAAALDQQFGATPGMFDHEPLCIDLSALPVDAIGPDFAALAELLRRQGFNPMAVRGGSTAQHAAALQTAGLAEADLAQGGKPAPALGPALPVPAAAPKAEPDEWPDTVPPDLFAAAEAQDAAIAAAAAAQATVPALEALPRPPALVIDKPLRSGQRVYARGADLIVLAVVSHGAEVIADGNIHVYAPLRGRALAGAQGDSSARIYAVRMEAQLVSIAGTWRTTEAGLPADVAGQPAQVRLDGDKLVFEALKF